MDFSKIKTWTINGKEVKILTVDGQVYWQKEEVPPVECKAFYVEDASGSANSLTLTKSGSAPDIKLEYSTDGTQWKEWVNCQSSALPIGANQKVYLRGTNNSFSLDYNANKFNCTGNYNVGGDISTLIDPNGNLINSKYFYCLFCKSNTLINAKDLILSATTLVDNCYSGMFQGCTSLVTAPALPATTLATYCYTNMFNGCTSLVTAPALPATTLASSCYSGMFNGCTSLETAPALSATNLAPKCYRQMFNGCTSLVTAPELPATTLSEDCYRYMFYDCSSLVKAPELPAMVLEKGCYASMFNGCTSLVKAPELPAEIVKIESYYDMFRNCSKLNSITIEAKTFYYNALYNWVNGVASSGTFTKPKGVDIPTGTSGIPSGWTVVEV